LLAAVLSTLAIISVVSRRSVTGTQDTPPFNTQAIVDQFYPQSLLDKAEAEGPGRVPLSRKSAYAVIETFSDGNPQTIIAAYSNGLGGAIRVIRADAARVFSVAYEPTTLLLTGVDCQAELVDVEGDGVREVLISFRSFRGPSEDWILRWDGSQLRNLGPVEIESDGMQSSVLSDSGLLDLDHTGTLSLVTLTGPASLGDEFPNPLPVVYKLEGGKFVLDRPLLFLSPFVRRTGQPETVAQSLFVPPVFSGPFVLKVINGERDGSRRVSSARIVLNGVEILSPNQFSQQVEFLTISINLQTENQIEVTLAGIPLGQVWISVEDQAAVQRARQQNSQP